MDDYDQTVLQMVNNGLMGSSMEMVKKVERALKIIKTVEEAERWMTLNKQNLRLFKRMLVLKKENPLRLEANIGLCKSYQRQLQRLRLHLVKQGGGVIKRQNRHLIWEMIEVHHKGRVKTGMITNLDYKDPVLFFNRAFPMFRRHVRRELMNHPLKVYIVFMGNFIKPVTEEEDVKTFITPAKEMYMTTDMQEWYNDHVKNYLLKKLEEFQERDSGWALDMIINIRVHINKYSPITAGTYCNLPPVIQYRKAVINVQNDDQHCFLWSIMSALFPVEKNPQRLTNYPHYKHYLKYDGLKFPMSLDQIRKFEKMNPQLSINVYGWKETFIRGLENFPVHVSSNTVGKKIHILALENGNSHHFCWIKNLAKLSVYGLTKDEHKIFICDRCMNYFQSELKLQQHLVDCSEKEAVRSRMPAYESERFIEFKNFDRKERVPYVVYADFEALLVPQHHEDMEMHHGSYTQNVQKHVPYSVGYYLHCIHDPNQSFYNAYRGTDCAKWFVKQLEQIAITYEKKFKDIQPMVKLTVEQELEFMSAEKCHICRRDFIADDIRVHDHSHITGYYRGAAHQVCNLNYHESKVLPIVMHNLSGYDSHFIIEPLLSEFEGQVDVLPINKEKYISFTKHVSTIQLRFIDSFRFLADKLENLASYLDNDKKTILKKEVGNDEQFQLLTRKGVFPYEYMSSWECLQETQLPPQEAFYSMLTDEHITDQDYSHAMQVWDTFGLHTLGQYSDLYMKTDVLLLADVFENFRDACLYSYGLDPAHYYTLPGYTWEAMLKYTNIRLELLTKIDDMLFIEKGIRGGVSQCSNRYAKANNKYITEGYNSTLPDHYLVYYDVVSLYGKTMCQPLPTGNFVWVETIPDVMEIADDSPVGYIFEVDLEMPQHLHDYFSDLPPCPETAKPPGSKQKYLLTTLYNKTRYVVHYRNLKMYIQLGVKVTQYHRVLQFDQSPWLKPYIDFNTEKRKNASNEFEKSLFKLIINSIFGKTIENIRKHRVVYIRKNWDGKHGVKKLIAKPNYHSMTVLNNDVSIVEMKKTDIYFNKPIYIGFTILDLSKTYVYDFHYNYMYPRYGRENVKLLYTDTDSLIYDISNTDVYEVMKQDIDRFDTADYAPDNVYGIPLRNKKVKGLMSDENNGNVMLEFVGLRSKMYAIRVQNKKETKRSKGLKKSTIRKLTFEDYKRCLLQNRNSYYVQQSIRSKRHRIHTIKQQKVGLSPYDQKRYITLNSTETKPWGHYNINR